MYTSKQKALSIVPHFTGLLSMLGSIEIIVDVVQRHRNRNKGRPNANAGTNTYHRLMMGMSTLDLCMSFMAALSTWPIPSGSGYATLGNDATCRAQGFFFMFGAGTPLYSACLALYYYLTIAKNIKKERILFLEKGAHILCMGWALVSAVAITSLDAVAPAVLWCFIAPTPAPYRWVFWYGPLWASIVATTAAMSALVYHITRQAKTQRAFSATRQRSNQNSALEKEKNMMKKQAFLYVASFYLTWVCLTAVRIMGAIEKQPPYWLFLMAGALSPVQGFFNYFIFIKPRYHRYRESHPDQRRLHAFANVDPILKAFRAWKKDKDFNWHWTTVTGPAVSTSHTPDQVTKQNTETATLQLETNGDHTENANTEATTLKLENNGDQTEKLV